MSRIEFRVKVLQENHEANKDLNEKYRSHLESLKKKLLEQTSSIVDIQDVFDKRIKNGKMIDTVN